MPRLEKHIPLYDHDDRRDYEDYDGFNAFGLGCHGDLFLHKVNKEMENDAGKDRTVAGKIDPGDDKSHGYRTDEEVDGKERIHHKAGLVSTLNKEQG